MWLPTAIQVGYQTVTVKLVDAILRAEYDGVRHSIGWLPASCDIVVCGNNSDLFRKLNNMAIPDCRNLALSDGVILEPMSERKRWRSRPDKPSGRA